jgi:hypothetical protein
MSFNAHQKALNVCWLGVDMEMLVVKLAIVSTNQYNLLILGGKLNLQYEKKPASAPRCGDCGEKLAGVSSLCKLALETTATQDTDD